MDRHSSHPGSAPPFSAVLCDIDGVLRHWPPADEIELAHGLPLGTIASAAFAPARLGPAVTGTITDDEWRALVLTDLTGICGSGERARQVMAAWNALVPRVDHEVAAILARARKRFPIALVSNATTRLEGDLERAGLADLTDAVLNSARIGFAKPDPRIYLAAAERVGAPAERCLFIDDLAENVEAARRLGMLTLHYRRRDQLLAALGLAGATS